VSIARREVAYQARKELAQRRDNRRVEAVELDSLDVADTGPGPGQVAAGAEMLEEFRRRLTPEERRLADLRAEGRGWTEIAGELGGMPEARRMQWNRVVERTARELGLKG